jgi:hypothetical protein
MLDEITDFSNKKILRKDNNILLGWSLSKFSSTRVSSKVLAEGENG